MPWRWLDARYRLFGEAHIGRSIATGLLPDRLRVWVTGGQVADTTRFETLLDIGPDITPRAALGDKGYSSKANRAAARARGIAPVIPHKANEKSPPAYA